MNLTHVKPHRILAAVAVCASLMTSLAPSAWAAPNASEEMKQEWVRHRQAEFKAHLDKMAERLEIKPSQQGAWQAFAKACMPPAMLPHDAKPGVEMDAATMARHHADMAAEHAQHLAQIADATAKLQEVLTPDQRKVLDQMARKFQHHGPHGRYSEHEHENGHGDGDGDDDHHHHPHD